MAEYGIASIFNGIVVAAGVFVLWTLTRWVPGPLRARYAAVVGGVAAVITFVVMSIVSSLA
jgi:hypothetical protein